MSVPVGVATKAGLSGAVGLFVAALVAAVADQTPEALGALAASTLSLLTVLGGRYAQAAAVASKVVHAADVELEGADEAVEAAHATDVETPDVPDVDGQGELA